MKRDKHLMIWKDETFNRKWQFTRQYVTDFIFGQNIKMWKVTKTPKVVFYR